MRKTASLAFSALMLGSLMGVSSGSASAAPQAAQPAATTQNVSASAECVKALDWYTKRSSRYVKVKNSCARTACFSVSIPWRKDPTFSIAANTTKEFRYGGALWRKGTGIKNKSC
ncbi:hypothetical protein [Streptomyces alkaliterrae]|uniref:Uncharacterized protein n=1 Tax=Streptomyces alkaliterrae TaxID=2213162 RepID=A0A5P0Z027_9ACTN|nr:hypothetical protein [Streptomyces alkaliterrae]MBB1256124.1 hypothetical protein [Streptomyces alkaliterrae]MBB1262047.1 hypothetical protein [Streptomyces alkaliterrae]MQS04669.1 hypothetical protein [Streptomyces alkaliterrae]